MDRRVMSVVARALMSVAVLATSAACARAVFVPPAGPGQPAPDAASAWREATARCAGLQSYAAALRVSGRVGGARVWPIGLEAAVRADQAIYLGATAAGRPVFVLAGSGARATLWLRREDRVVTAAPADILGAIMGVSATPADLLGALSGCVNAGAPVSRAARHGRRLAIETPGARIYLDPEPGGWRVRAAETPAYSVEYAPTRAAWPHELWLWPAGGTGATAAIRVVVDDARVNEPVADAVFRVPARAAAAAPMTLDELRSGVVWKNRVPSPERP